MTETPGNGARLVVEFFWAADRFAHRVLLQSGDASRAWLASQEGDAKSDWPASPPLQQLSIETQATGDVALLLGMAGRSHWSLSVESLAGELRFDAACRVKDKPQALGSRYQILDADVPAMVLAEGDSGCEQPAAGLHILPSQVAGDVVRWSYRAVIRS